MKRHRRRKCLHCQELFRPDPRNVRHQRCCSKPDCRKASKAASQRRWLGKPENRDYFKGEANVRRVQAWRKAHPGYWRRQGRLKASALQEHSSAQVIDNTKKSDFLTETALQDLLFSQPFVFIGLIATLTGSALQDDIARTGRHLRELGQDIVAGGCDAKTSVGSFPSAPDPPSVQLGGSSPGA